MNIAESAGQHTNESSFLEYDEWNHSKQEYRTSYWRVYPKYHMKKGVAYYNQTIQQFQSELLSLRKKIAD